MAISSSRWLRLSRFFVPVTLIILFSAYLFTPPAYIPHPIPTLAWTNPTSNVSQSKYTLERKEKFIQDAIGWEIDGAYNDSALRNLCSSREAHFREGLIFKCDDAYGGVGNIRNIILNCIRYAIEAGATSLIIPQITTRDVDLVNLQTGNTCPFTYMFDQDFFTSSLSAACPQLRIIAHENELNSSIPQAELTPKELCNRFKVDRVLDYIPIEWRALFDQWLNKYGSADGFSTTSPFLISIHPPLFEFPILYDERDFVATFGRIIRFHSSLLRLAAMVLYALDKTYNLGIEPGKIGIPDEGKFYGAHLRTDADAIAASFASYDEQSSAYLAGAQKHNLNLIYLASGSPPDIDRFTKTAAERGINVTTKSKLLESSPEFTEALEEMKNLTWDQQALIDYMILLRSSHFGGTWASSFSYNIVFRRHVVVGNGTWVPSAASLSARNLDTRAMIEEELDMMDLETLGEGEALTVRHLGAGYLEERYLDLDLDGEKLAATDLKELAARSLDNRQEALEPGECFKDKINTIFGKETMGLWFELSMWP